ncbi:spore gernimation protein [Peribacillus cavernae]|uniref:Spore gernimation protein n=1 Tax=Peribacillus cavernae TaxID=1674310 RepID=A0A3S0TXD1_9BACI|nr:GerAB/ArcD/ProY family transporter [Peribacillus cavernae]MDQ0219892.1 spore germination protein (amino acid permease) [Peribacillus cavernae]RUQ26625.1 spore gernimation protein [Peribacillus cavernae]
MKTPIKEQFLVAPFLVFFLVHSTQLGVGVLSFQRDIAEFAGQDSWITVIVSGIIVHVLIWMIYTILNKEKSSLIVIHQNVFGKWLGGLINILFILHFLVISIVVLRTFIEVVQVWMFPSLRTLPLALVYLCSVYYVVSSGFRTVTGVCFIGVIFSLFLIVTFLAPWEFSTLRNLLPVYDHSFKEMANSIKEMTFPFIGFEFLLMYYPFIQKPKTSQKWAHYGNLATMAIYLILMLTALVYFEQEHLLRTSWPTLTMWKIINFSFLERFELIGIAFGAVVVFPKMCLVLWAASRATKELFKVRQIKILVFLLSICLIGSCILKDRDSIDLLQKFVSMVGFYLSIVYIPILFLIYHLRFRMGGKR